jgi:hypothetical protein
MATTSKFLQLSASILLEYVYADQSAINQPGNPYRLSTTTNPIWKSKNDHNNEDIIMNADSAEIIKYGEPIGTGNVRNRAYAYVDPYKSALLDIDRLDFYNDYDPSLTPTASLPINFTNEKAPVYDTIKLHLVQGFNFEQFQGFTFNVKIKRKDGKSINLANLVYNKTDTFETLNPSSFFFAGRIYASYVEIRVLSLYNLIYDYWLGTLDGDTVVERITEGLGVKRDQQIQFNFSWIRERRQFVGQDYIYLEENVAVDIPIQDQFESIAAEIKESENGDYIEFYATYKGDIIENFILDLNKNGYNYMLLHDLTVQEWIYDPDNNEYYWQNTSDLQLSQIDNYDLPNTFRPVIKNSSAVAFKIDYIVRLYNRNDNSQIWKRSSFVSYSAAKYGRKLQQINLGENPIKSVIYNKNVIKEIKINRISEPVLDNAKYITSFIDSTNVSISFDTVNDINASATGEQSSSFLGGKSSNIYQNGIGKILISDSYSYLKFVLYQRDPKTGSNAAINLSGIGDLILTFTSETGENFDIIEFPTNSVSKTSGEVVFRITEPEAKKILNFTNKKFKIYLKNQKGEKTFLYTGRFYNQDEWLTLSETDRITILENTISSLTESNSRLNTQVSDQSTLIDSLNKSISDSTSRTGLKDSIIDSLNTQVKNLNETISLLESKVLKDQNLLDALKKQQDERSKSLVIKTGESNSKKEQDLETNKASIQKTKLARTSGVSYSGITLRRISGVSGSGVAGF